MPHREDTEAAGPRTRGAAARGGESGSSSPHPNEESGSSGTHTSEEPGGHAGGAGGARQEAPRPLLSAAGSGSGAALGGEARTEREAPWHEVPAAREESSISPQLVPRPGARANPWRRQQCTPSELHTKPLYLLLHNAEEGKQLRQEKQHGGWGFFWVAYRENKLAHCQRARESSMFA
ncbi:unnamed protein product [Lampetra planeri]